MPAYLRESTVGKWPWVMRLIIVLDLTLGAWLVRRLIAGRGCPMEKDSGLICPSPSQLFLGLAMTAVVLAAAGIAIGLMATKERWLSRGSGKATPVWRPAPGVLALWAMVPVAGMVVGGVVLQPRSSRYPQGPVCVIDTRVLRSAQEAYRNTSGGRYANDMTELVAAGLLSEPSRVHKVVMPGVPTHDDNLAVEGTQPPPYDILVVARRCGIIGHWVHQTPNDV